MLLKGRKQLRKFSNHLRGVIKELEDYTPKLKITKVLWEVLYDWWFKYSIDGASKGNPRPSSYAFYVKDSNEDLLYTECRLIEDTKSTQEKATTYYKPTNITILLHTIILFFIQIHGYSKGGRRGIDMSLKYCTQSRGNSSCFSN